MSVSDSRRGEVHELRLLLNSPKSRDPSRYKAVVEKVIAYMTLGIDVSPLFTDMIMATHTADLVQKKMVYLYLCNYAEQHSELALLAVNTLQKDCQDDDPMVRGLALRSLCSLNVAKLVEYILLPLRKGMVDASPYVRKIAVLGCAKLFSIDPVSFKETSFIEDLYNTLRDTDSEVVVNSVYALNEILADEGGMATNKKIMYHLVNKIHSIHEWGQCVFLELLSTYSPESSDEIFDLMNALEDRLRHSNAAVVLATIKVFLCFTKDMPRIHVDVFRRLRAPLLTMSSNQNTELSYSVFCHISSLVKRCPDVFADDYKNFFIRYCDPFYIQSLKLDILSSLADTNNASDILLELDEYVTSTDKRIARLSIQAIGKIAVRVDSVSSEAIEHLLGFLDFKIEYISTGTVISMKDILRKYPSRHYEILPGIHKSLKSIDDAEGKASVIWMIGEYGDVIEDAPYMLNQFVSTFENEESPMVKLEILTATMKLFFKRPPEVHKLLGDVLSAAIFSSEVDIRDRASFFYRLLAFDVHEAARVVNCSKVNVDAFVEDMIGDLSDRLFSEFNSLSIIYGKSADQFINSGDNQGEEFEDENSIYHSDGGDDESNSEQIEVNLLSMDFLGDVNMSDGVRLVTTPQCDPELFQQQWSQLELSSQMSLKFEQAGAPNLIETLMREEGFEVMASGEVDGLHKFYFFAQSIEPDCLILAELLYGNQDSVLSANFKCQDHRIGEMVSDRLEKCFSAFT